MSASVTPSATVSQNQPKQKQKQSKKGRVVVPYSSEPDDDEEETRPPENLHPLNYARKILEQLEFPVTADNMRVVAVLGYQDQRAMVMASDPRRSVQSEGG